MVSLYTVYLMVNYGWNNMEISVEDLDPIDQTQAAGQEISFDQLDPEPSLLSRAGSGLKSIPGNLASMVAKAPGLAMTLADILTMRPSSTGGEDLMSLLKGGAQGLTAGIYSQEQPATEQGQRYSDLGQTVGTLAPWSLLTKGLRGRSEER